MINSKPAVYLIGEIHETGHDSYNNKAYERIGEVSRKYNIPVLIEDLTDLRNMDAVSPGILGKSTILPFAERVNGEDLSPTYNRMKTYKITAGDVEKMRLIKDKSIANDIEKNQL